MEGKDPVGATMDQVLFYLDYDSINWEAAFSRALVSDVENWQQTLYGNLFEIWWTHQTEAVKSMVSFDKSYPTASGGMTSLPNNQKSKHKCENS